MTATTSPNTYLATSPATPVSGQQTGLYLERATNDLVLIDQGLPVKRLLGPCITEDFFGATKVSDVTCTDLAAGPWRTKDTSSSGSPTMVIVGDGDDGQFAMTFASTSEEEDLTLYWGDEQNIDPAKGPMAFFRIKVSAQTTANEKIVFGLASAQADDPDSVASNAWFMITGANLNIYVETDNGTTDTDDKDTGYDHVADTFYEYCVDARNYAAVKFWLRTSLTGTWVDVTPASTTFALHATTGLQPFVQARKTTGATTTATTVDYITAHWQRT